MLRVAFAIEMQRLAGRQRESSSEIRRVIPYVLVRSLDQSAMHWCAGMSSVSCGEEERMMRLHQHIESGQGQEEPPSFKFWVALARAGNDLPEGLRELSIIPMAVFNIARCFVDNTIKIVAGIFEVLDV